MRRRGNSKCPFGCPTPHVLYHATLFVLSIAVHLYGWTGVLKISLTFTNRMAIINSILQERFEAGVKDIFMAGAKPTHVDFVIFACVPFTFPLSALYFVLPRLHALKTLADSSFR